MAPFSERYVKPKDTRITTRQMSFPGVPRPGKPIRMPVELRKNRGDCWRQEYLVEDVVTGVKSKQVYGPTQRRPTARTEDVEAHAIAHGREVHGEVFDRSITWVGPNGGTRAIKKLRIPTDAEPRDLMFRIAYALELKELDPRFVEITPEDWRHSREIQAEFVFDRPTLDRLEEVKTEEFRRAFVPSIPVFVEIDGACAGNCEKKSAGGWGAAVVQEKRTCKMWGAKNDTSNNEMEYQAMLSALEVIPFGIYICFETDSQQCIDGLTKRRRIWEKHRWHREDGKPAENAELIAQVATLCDKNAIGFRKIKGHSHGPWNDLADELAVKGRNRAASNVTIQLIFRAVIDRKEKVFTFPRLSLSSHANIHDFWPHLVQKAGSAFVGEPEDCEIWEGRRKLDKPLIMGLEYEIISKISPGHAKPADVSRPKRRISFDEGSSPPRSQPSIQSTKSAHLAPDGPVPVVTRSKADAERYVPPHLRATVTYQASDAPEKVWNGWFSEEDTEESLETSARRVLGILGNWRRLLFWRDHEGVRIVMTNKRKETTLRYQDGSDPEVHEMKVSENDTPP
jgi:ribonuclease HI